jgi:hypothetical protein
MATSVKKAVPRSIYVVKVALVGVKPSIWRRLLIWSDTSLRQFHDVLQVSFGWTDSHLHMFVAGEDTYGFPDPDGEMGWIKNDARTKIAKVLSKPKDSIVYEYDFGDSWQHKIVLEKTLADPGPMQVPSCVAGERACPPEDCGGVWGYCEFLKAIADPLDSEHEAMLEWIGGEFDPEHFDLEAVNRVLAS